MVDKIHIQLKKPNYCVDELTVVSREVIATKKVKDAYSVPQSIADNLKSFSKFLNGIPLIVAEEYKGENLEEEVVYTRHNIPVVSEKTAESLIEGRNSYFIYVNKGGIFVKIDGKKLKEIRERKGISRTRLARELGVSIKAVAYYEEGVSDVSLEIASKLEEIIGDEVFERLNIESLKELVPQKETVAETKNTKSGKENRDIERLIQFLKDMIKEKYFFDKAPFDAGFKVSTSMFHRIAVKTGIQEAEELEEISKISKATHTPTIVLGEENTETASDDENLITLDKQKIEKIREILARNPISRQFSIE